jgi:hypothetical protein
MNPTDTRGSPLRLTSPELVGACRGGPESIAFLGRSLSASLDVPAHKRGSRRKCRRSSATRLRITAKHPGRITAIDLDFH